MPPSSASKELLQTHSNLRNVLEKYPGQAPSLVQTLIDLTFASKWDQLRVLEMSPSALPELRSSSQQTSVDTFSRLGHALIYGIQPEAKGVQAVFPCSISDMLHTQIFKDIFLFLDQLSSSHNPSLPPLVCDHFLLAVHSQDATVVYYNIARGLVKPVN